MARLSALLLTDARRGSNFVQQISSLCSTGAGRVRPH
jgi:hypothetical protein